MVAREEGTSLNTPQPVSVKDAPMAYVISVRGANSFYVFLRLSEDKTVREVGARLFLGEGGEQLDVLRRALLALHPALGQWGEDEQRALIILTDELIRNLRKRERRVREVVTGIKRWTEREIVFP